jgi:2-polyprenyl-6-methoxyphenol hydroxylase-like FAD-dependent oxidoreductase
VQFAAQQISAAAGLFVCFWRPRYEGLLGVSKQTADGGVCMSTLIVGSGLAGLAAAVKAKLLVPEEEVCVLEKPARASNTQVADQRYRAGVAGKRKRIAPEIEQLLASRNDGILTDRMAALARLAEKELDFWQNRPDFIRTEDRREWFGPLWGTPNKTGKGWGRSVLASFKNLAESLGVVSLRGEAKRLLLEGDHMAGIEVETKDGPKILEADRYVLANGSVSGRMFRDTTNVRIRDSAHELAFAAGLTLTDSTTHMVHPFGHAGPDGKSHRGCFPVDELVDATVYIDGEPDPETTELLRTYQAREHFPAITKRFRERGGVVELRFPDGTQVPARVAHHSGHIGIETVDGVAVRGAEGLYAAGDASTIAYWTNHRMRHSGFGLLKCLTDAALIAEAIGNGHEQGQASPLLEYGSTRPPKVEGPDIDEERLREINSDHLDAWLDGTDRGAVGEAWGRALQSEFGQDSRSILREVSLATAYAHHQVGAGEAMEPFPLNREMLGRVRY